MKDNCKVCNRPLSLHQVVLSDGVAHTVIFNDKGQRTWCSDEDRDRHYMLGEIQALRGFVRSLRYRAGQLRNAERTWNHEDLLTYSDRFFDRRNELLDHDRKYHPWAKRK